MLRVVAKVLSHNIKNASERRPFVTSSPIFVAFHVNDSSVVEVHDIYYQVNHLCESPMDISTVDNFSFLAQRYLLGL